MPYENEHSARIRNPNDFDENPKWQDGKPGKFRRTKNGKLYGKINVPNSISTIWGKLKGKAGLKDPVVAQALRFAKQSWSAEKAKKWLKDNKIKYISFEPARKESKQSLVDSQVLYANPSDNPFVFTMPGIVEFSGGDNQQEKKNLRLTLYDGSVVKHWFWGFLAFDQKTMQMAKKRNPILYSHDVNSRIAYSDKAVFEPKFVMEGPFLKNSSLAEEIKNQMDEGFPFEGSLRFDPDHSDIELVKEGETVEVNGKKLKGPGTVVRNATIIEGSVCVFGALKNTKSQSFESNTIFKELIMLNETITEMTIGELTADNFAELLPDLHSQIIAKGKAEAQKSAAQNFAELKKVCGDDHELLIDCLEKQRMPAEATAARMTKLEATNKEQAEQIKKLSEKKIDPAITEFSDTAPDPKATEKFDEAKATEQQLKDHYAQNQDLQDEFHDEASYLAYVKKEVQKGGK